MRVLLSTIGSRGDVQPLVALALELRALGHESRICAPPDFRELVEGYGFSFVPVGSGVRYAGAKRSVAPQTKPSADAMHQLMSATTGGQFAALGEAADDCDIIVAAGALQYAAP